ncbi:Hypothetical predicted protein, partial [Paramuricea clavata]
MSFKKSAAKDQFPLGELAQERKKLREDCVAKNATIVQLRNDLKQVDKDIERTTKRLKRRKEKLTSLLENDDETGTRLPSKRKMTFRQMTPSEANVENSDTFQASLSETSSRRRQKETLNACKEIHGDQKGKKSSALAGMWVKLDNKSSTDTLKDFLSNSETVNKKIMPSIVKSETELYQSAELYIVVDQTLPTPFLHHFGSTPYHFRIALGAPFGKDDEATAWLISFSNVGKHVQSQNDNFLLCGANCSETHMSMQRYARKLVSDIAYIEKQTYKIKAFDVKFTVDLLPSDMKWLSFMGGELNNAAYYFSPFGDVNNDNKMASNGSLGEDASCTWHPWVYNDRIKLVSEMILIRNDPETKLRLAAIAYCCLQLRDAISYFSRVNIDQAGIDGCKKACQHTQILFDKRNDPLHTKYTKYKSEYIPKEVSMENICYCGFPLEAGLDNCSICSSDSYEAVKKSAAAGSLTPELT